MTFVILSIDLYRALTLLFVSITDMTVHPNATPIAAPVCALFMDPHPTLIITSNQCSAAISLWVYACCACQSESTTTSAAITWCFDFLASLAEVCRKQWCYHGFSEFENLSSEWLGLGVEDGAVDSVAGMRLYSLCRRICVIV
jgi:hypothetical protein